MIVLVPRCGLGNQMFEYAYARHLMQKRGETKIYMDLSEYIKDEDGREFKLSHFSLPEDTVMLKGLPWLLFRMRFFCIRSYCHLRYSQKAADRYVFYLRKGIYRWNFEDCNDVYSGKLHILYGIFQNRRYSDYMYDEIKQCFQIKTPVTDESVKNMLQRIETSESVCVHIRRGDYASNERWSKKLLICNEDYYKKGIQYVQERHPDAVFYVFSNSHDDICWIKDNYDLKGSIVYVDLNGSDIDDFRLMLKCRHFIISNSSFSWWAQYLSDYQDGIVVAPSYWDTNRGHYNGIYMDRWVEIDV